MESLKPTKALLYDCRALWKAHGIALTVVCGIAEILGALIQHISFPKTKSGWLSSILEPDSRINLIAAALLYAFIFAIMEGVAWAVILKKGRSVLIWLRVSALIITRWIIVGLVAIIPVSALLFGCSTYETATYSSSLFWVPMATLFFLTPALILGLRWIFAVPCMLEKNSGVFSSLTMSRKLVQANSSSGLFEKGEVRLGLLLVFPLLLICFLVIGTHGWIDRLGSAFIASPFYISTLAAFYNNQKAR